MFKKQQNNQQNAASISPFHSVVNRLRCKQSRHNLGSRHPRKHNTAGPRRTATMAFVPGAAAVAKAPPAGILQRVQFENLAGTSDDTPSPSAANSSPATEPAYEDAMVWITSAEQNSSGEQSNALPSNQQPPPQPAQEETHHTVRPVISTGRPAANPEPRSPWADIRE